MKKTFLFLVIATAMFSVRCTHNYYYGTVYTTPGHESSHSSHTSSSTIIHGTGSGSGSSGSGTSTGNTPGNAGSPSGSSAPVNPPGRPTGSPSQVDPPGRPTGTTTGSGSGSSSSGGTIDQPGTGTGNPANTTTLPQQINTRSLFRTWMHSHEEDEGQVQVYRPSTFAFPPSRGRSGYTFEAGGKVIQHDIASTDGTQNNTGTWTIRNKTLNISSIKEQRPYQMEIVYLDDKVLRLKRR